jgi:acyl carrier protein
VDIDSMDFLKVVVALHAAVGLDIPEADYPKVQTMGSAVAYLVSKAKR